MRPVVYMVTRPVASAVEGRTLADRIAAAARAGVHLVQVRQPDLEGRALAELVEAALGAVRGTRTRVLVNDRVDVALATGAHGVHLRGDSVAAARIRTMTPAGFLIGRSVHAPDEAARAAAGGGLDYLVFGTVFGSPSKPGAPAAGAVALAAACQAVPLPVLAIGGVTPGRLAAVAHAGAAGVAAIGLFADCPLDEMPALVAEMTREFDSGERVP